MVIEEASEILYVTIQNVPANLHQLTEMQPEAVVFLLFRKDPLFQIGRQTVMSKTPISHKKQKQAEKRGGRRS